VMSYTVARRTAELGIRFALGATRASVLSLIFRNVLFVVGAGLLLGLALSFASVRAVSSMLFGLSPYDPLTIVGAAAVLTIVAILAGLRPALRAARVDPMEALRTE
jgi:ABC-type antimicrobial peptide transport system permease subunit